MKIEIFKGGLQGWLDENRGDDLVQFAGDLKALRVGLIKPDTFVKQVFKAKPDSFPQPLSF